MIVRVFLFFHEDIGCGLSIELPQRGSSTDGPQRKHHNFV